MAAGFEFDFAKHRSDAVESYRGKRGLYEAFANVVRDILRISIPPEYQIHSLEARAKDLESFATKAEKAADNDPARPRYPEPLRDITDLAGVRVIVFFPKTISEVDACINDEFTVIEKSDKAEELIAADRFGYQSIHYLIRLKTSRTLLPEYKRFEGLTAEIQLRTILQHAWAEMEHDIQYKSLAAIPLSIRRRFMSLAGLLELADREFQAVQDDDERLRKQDRSTVQEGLAEVVDLQQKVAPLETQIRETQERRPDSSTYVPGSARALIDQGYYLEAVRAYDKVIESHPGTHTPYIGRARARLLAGDAEGARSDLSKAEEIYPFDPVIERLKLQIREGPPPASTSAFRTPAQEAVSRGNQELSKGDAPGAFAAYTKAEALGWSPVYSKFNRAMALCLANETEKASLLLDEIKPEPGSFMEINVLALRCLFAIRGGYPHQELLDKLRALDRVRQFEDGKSPIRYLEAGLQSLEGDFVKYAAVFRVLRGEIS